MRSGAPVWMIERYSGHVVGARVAHVARMERSEIRDATPAPDFAPLIRATKLRYLANCASRNAVTKRGIAAVKSPMSRTR